MPTFQNLNERGNISRYEYDKINLGQTGKFYADESTPFKTIGAGSVFSVQSISDEGGGMYKIELNIGADTSDFVIGAKIRVYTAEKVANAICELIAVDGVNITVSCNTDISQSIPKGFAEYHPFYGGWEIQALGDTVLAFDEDKSFGNKPATINLADGDTIKARRISSVTVTSGVAAISLL